MIPAWRINVSQHVNREGGREKQKERTRKSEQDVRRPFNLMPADGILVLSQKHTVIFVKGSRRMNPRAVQTGMPERKEKRGGEGKWGIKIRVQP